ncbi:MAG TPA: tRNA glutamyl-Q(34) synthetase GluQRS [Devosia sp.]|nr:tRNA glutamyl-Q(34) synthetase GluQRS [Devosia sp.]
MPSEPILRFAPSPNGFLHLGHAYSALVVDRWANQLGGNWLLRIEDIDEGRSKPAFVEAIFEDLHWLGLKWPEPVLKQSVRQAAYKRAAAQLDALGLLYPCFCSRTDIRDASNGQTDPDGAPIYPGTCKALSKEEISHNLRQNQPVQYRLDVGKALEKTGMLTFTTVQPTPLDRPEITYARPQRWGDTVIQRKDTPTSYHLSVVVDDAHQNITHVVRGRDLEAVTDIHVLLQFLLSLPTPLYTFHKLILDDEKSKLSKSRGSTTLRDLREKGWTAQTVRAHLGI